MDSTFISQIILPEHEPDRQRRPHKSVQDLGITAMKPLPDYLCPDEFSYWCMGKSACVKDEAACRSMDTVEKRPGFKSIGTGDVVVQGGKMLAHDLFESLNDIVPQSIVKGMDHNANNVVRFCAKHAIALMGEHTPVWIKLVCKRENRNDRHDYEKCRREHEFYTEQRLTAYTPHIVPCTASRIHLDSFVDFLDREAKEQTVISQTNQLMQNGEKCVAMIYKQPENWVYLETFLKGQPYIVTENTLISILFQVLFTLACIQTKQLAHSKLSVPKTIAVDLDPKEKYITYYYNNTTFRMPVSVKVIILNWENVTTVQHPKSSDVSDFMKRFFGVLESRIVKHSFTNTLKSKFYKADPQGQQTIVPKASEHLKNEVFMPFRGTH